MFDQKTKAPRWSILKSASVHKSPPANGHQVQGKNKSPAYPSERLDPGYYHFGAGCRWAGKTIIG